MKILMLAYSGMTPLDLMGPLQVWSLWPEVQIQVVARSTAAIATDTVVQLLPTHNFDNCFETPDILFVPGGTKATFELLSDQPTLDFLRLKGERAQWITSVCTGALVLGAAGLLEGYQATTHWAAVDNLTTFGAIATEGRVVFDRNRVTGGGITAGIDFGLALVAKLADEQTAKVIQLALEYAPQPPFESGTPRQASEETVQAVLSQFAEALV